MLKIKDKIINNEISILIILMSTTIMINIPFALTNSGVIAIYLSDVVSLFCLLYLLIDLQKYRKTYTKVHKRTIFFSLLFLIYIALVLIYRAFTGFIDTKSLMIPRVYLMSVWFYIFVIRGIISLNVLKKALRYFIFIISLATILLFFTTSPVAYKFLQSPAIRTSTLMFAYPIVVYGLISDYKLDQRKRHLILITFLTLSLVVAGISSGSRINALIIPTEILVMIIAAIINEKKTLKTIIIGFIAGFLFVISVYPISYRYRIGSSRSPLFNSVETIILEPLSKKIKFIDLFGEPRYLDPNAPSDDIDIDELNEITDASKLDSSNSRFGVWKLAFNDIKQAPLIGPGLKDYQIEYSTGSTHIIPPHNFILEYTLGFGLIGLLLFLLSVFYPIYSVLKHLFKDVTESFSYLLVLVISLGAIGVNILFQPLLLNPPITLLIFAISGLLVVYPLNDIEI